MGNIKQKMGIKHSGRWEIKMGIGIYKTESVSFYPQLQNIIWTGIHITTVAQRILHVSCGPERA